MDENIAVTNFNPAIINAEEMYRCIFRNRERIESIPIQFIPVTKLPEWVNPEHRQEPCILITEDSFKTIICLIVHSPSMIETIDKVITQDWQNLICYQVPSIAELLNYRICSSVSGKKLIKIYEHALSISKKLHISLPVILVVDKEQIPGDNARRRTILNEDDTAIGDIIEIGYAGTLNMIHCLAHELRHCWQEYKRPEEFYQDFIPTGQTTYEDYNSQKEEIDAEAYACYYLNTLGFDGMKYSYCEDIDYDLYHAVKKRMNEIEGHESLR